AKTQDELHGADVLHSGPGSEEAQKIGFRLWRDRTETTARTVRSQQSPPLPCSQVRLVLDRHGMAGGTKHIETESARRINRIGQDERPGTGSDQRELRIGRTISRRGETRVG